MKIENFAGRILLPLRRKKRAARNDTRLANADVHDIVEELLMNGMAVETVSRVDGGALSLSKQTPST